MTQGKEEDRAHEGKHLEHTVAITSLECIIMLLEFGERLALKR